MSFERIVDLPPRVADHYFWRSEREVCFFHHHPADGDPLQPGHFELVAVNTETGEAGELRAFNERYAGRLIGSVMLIHFEGVPGYQVKYHPPGHAVSPDGQWLAWTREFPPSEAGWTVASLNGDVGHQMGRSPELKGEPMHLLWFPDSRNWAVVHSRYQGDRYLYPAASIQALGNPEGEQQVSITGGQDGLLLGMDETQNALYRLDLRNEPGVTTAHLQRVPLRAGAVAATFSEILLPAAAEISDAIVSPSGTQLAWILCDADQETEPHEIWLSGLDGEEMRRVASVPSVEVTDPHHMGQWYPFPEKLAWRPGGSEVSFLYHNALWSVPISATS